MKLKTTYLRREPDGKYIQADAVIGAIYTEYAETWERPEPSRSSRLPSDWHLISVAAHGRQENRASRTA